MTALTELLEASQVMWDILEAEPGAPTRRVGVSMPFAALAKAAVGLKIKLESRVDRTRHAPLLDFEAMSPVPFLTRQWVVNKVCHSILGPKYGNRITITGCIWYGLPS